MAPRQACKHERARFHNVHRLGKLSPIELWHCPSCKSTIDVGAVRKSRTRLVAA